MTDQLDIDTAMKLASEAFQPYGCVTSANPEDDSFGLSVMNAEGQEVLAIPHVPRTQYGQPLRLSGVLEQARLDLTHKGCHLDPWTMPFITDASAIPETTPNY